MQTKKDDSAFPIFDDEGAFNDYVRYGLSKREYMATHIMMGILAAADFPFDMAPKEAVRLTDKLIKELNLSDSNEESNTEKQSTVEAGSETEERRAPYSRPTELL